MISAIAIVCSLANPSNCQTISAARIFPTVEMCKEDRVNAEGFAASRGYAVVLYLCYNWGQTV
jgi:hypothetical protein